MQFTKIAKIQIVSTLIRVAIAIVMAICGFGYWALVIRPIASSLCVAIGARGSRAHGGLRCGRRAPSTATDAFGHAWVNSHNWSECASLPRANRRYPNCYIPENRIAR
jgi:uncharacterized membrane protein